VFLQESGAEFQPGHRRELEQLVGRKLATHFHYLIVNKPGLTPKGIQRKKFERSFRRNLRVQDARAGLDAIVPAGDRIILIGYSEGAYLAPEVALKDPRIRSVVMIGGGTRGWLQEELNNARKKDRPQVRAQIREIERHPKSERSWNGFSFATWYSYREDSTLHALKHLHVPVLAILGKRDRTIDLKSARQDFKALSAQHPIRVELLKRCGHSFKGHWGTVRRVLRDHIRSLP